MPNIKHVGFVALLLVTAEPALVSQLPAAQTSQRPGTATSSVETKNPASDPVVDPKEIIRRSVETDHRNWELARNYTCQQREIEKQLDSHGETKSTTAKTFDISFYYGEEYSRLIQKDGKPLGDAEQKKEDEKLEKFLANLHNQSESDREKRLEKQKKEREEQRAFLRDVVNAYDFKLIGDETVNGADAWVIEATPRKDFHPTQPHAEVLSKIQGRIWVEKKEYNWIKVEAESIDTISFGLFLFRIHKGARFSFEQVHLNDEVWLMRRFYINGGARIALLKNMAIEQEDEFSDYKKFMTTTHILPGVNEVPTGPSK